MPFFSFRKYVGEYALCTSAKCKKNPISGTLQCNCSVKKGLAVGLKGKRPTGNFQPFKVKNTTFLYSLYSGINSKLLNKKNCLGKKNIWGDCLNKLCVKTTNNKAICFCSPVSSKRWVTFQPKSNLKPCRCNNLSGALNVAYQNINNFYNTYAKV